MFIVDRIDKFPAQIVRSDGGRREVNVKWFIKERANVPRNGGPFFYADLGNGPRKLKKEEDRSIIEVT